MQTDRNNSTLVEQYIRQFPPEIGERLNKIREIIRKAAPEATEVIAYQMPTYRLNGNLIHYAAFKHHIGLYPTPGGIEAFKKELAEFKWAKGSIQFPHDKPVPYDLILRIVDYRVSENSKKGTQKGNKYTLTDAAVLKATGKGWANWFNLLNEEGFAAKPHTEIVKFLTEKLSTPGWWAQSITVEYERYLGRRQTGQVKDGTFQTAVSKTMPGDKDQVFDFWLAAVCDEKELNSIPLAGKPAISKSEKWRFWRVDLQDGSKVTVTVGAKTTEKSILTFSNEKLKSRDDIEPWKTFWKAFIKSNTLKP
jgi:uncharacterized protein YdhG (YjbR/CyaY superfamily)